MNELKLKLKEAFPDLNGSVVEEIIASTEFINKDVQAMIDNSVASVKDEYTVQEIDEYAEYIETYTQNFLEKLDKLGIHWLISQLPTGVNFSSDEMKNITSKPFSVKSVWASFFITQLSKHKTFMIHGIFKAIRESVPTHTIRGVLVKKSIFAEILC